MSFQYRINQTLTQFQAEALIGPLLGACLYKLESSG